MPLIRNTAPSSRAAKETSSSFRGEARCRSGAPKDSYCAPLSADRVLIHRVHVVIRRRHRFHDQAGFDRDAVQQQVKAIRIGGADHSGEAHTDDERVMVIGPEKLAELVLDSDQAWQIGLSARFCSGLRVRFSCRQEDNPPGSIC